MTPTDLAGKDVLVKWQVKVGRRWADGRDHNATIGAAGTYSWTFTVKKRGLFRIHALMEATPDTAAVVTTWRRFTVK